MPLARALYRSRQVLVALWPRISEEDLRLASEVLGRGELDVFLAMEKRDRRHGIEVMRRLCMAGCQERDLLAAALLHDCGKGQVPVWLRIAFVVSPATTRRLAREGDPGWRGAAYRLVEHATLGAALTRRAGSTEATVRYIAGLPEPGEDDRIEQLRAADDRS